MTTTATKLKPVREIPFILRVIWFFLLGWHMTGIWILVAWALNVTIIFLPLGLWMIDRVPQVLTLKARSGAYVTNLDSGQSRFITAGSPPFLIRAVYFIVIGWWASLLWAALAWLLCASIIFLPVGVPMLNMLPLVTTLQRS